MRPRRDAARVVVTGVVDKQLTCRANNSSAGLAYSCSCREATPRLPGSSQRSYARAGRMTGMGLWTEAASALASVVRMAQVSSTLLLCFHDSHRAANAMGLPSLDPKKYGFFLLSAFHSN